MMFFVSYFDIPYSVLSIPNIIITFRPHLSIHIQNFRFIPSTFILKSCDFVVICLCLWTVWKMLAFWRHNHLFPFPVHQHKTIISYIFCNCSRLFMLIWWFWCYYRSRITKCVSINSYFGFSNTFHCVAFIFTLFVRFCFFEINNNKSLKYYNINIGLVWVLCVLCTHTLILVSFTIYENQIKQKFVELNILSLLLSG